MVLFIRDGLMTTFRKEGRGEERPSLGLLNGHKKEAVALVSLNYSFDCPALGLRSVAAPRATRSCPLCTRNGTCICLTMALRDSILA